MKDPCKECVVKPICSCADHLSISCCEEKLEYLSYKSTKHALMFEFLFCMSKIFTLVAVLVILIKEIR